MAGRSINELRSAFLKAFRGAGLEGRLDIGGEVELAEACIALQIFGHNAVEEARKLCSANPGNEPQSPDVCKLPAWYDLACVTREPYRQNVPQEHAVIVAAIASTYGVQLGCATRLEANNLEADIGAGADLAIALAALAPVLSGPSNTNVEIEILVTGDADGNGSCGGLSKDWKGPLEVNDRDWQTLLALAATTYVPANEHSRSFGAGAGLNDND